MQYDNARDLLPQELLDELQKYAAGKLLYVPSRGARRPWGEQTGYKKQIAARNAAIRRAFAEGVPVDSLADEHALTPETVKKIVYDKKERNMMELNQIVKLYTDEEPSSVSIVSEISKDYVDPPIWFLESVVSFTDRKFSLIVCDYCFVTPERIAQCDRVIAAYRAAGYDCPRILPDLQGRLTSRVSYNGRECTVFAQEYPRKMRLKEYLDANETDGRFACHDELIAVAAKIAALHLEGSEIAAMEIFAPITACGAAEDFTKEYLLDLRNDIMAEHPALIDRFERIEALFDENRDRLRPLYQKLPTSLFQMMESRLKEVLVNEDGSLSGFVNFYDGGRETCLNYLFHVIDSLRSEEYEGDNACEEMESADLRGRSIDAFARDLKIAAQYYRFSELEIKAAPMVYKNLLLGERYYWQIMDYARGDDEKLSAFFDYLEKQLTADEIDFAALMRSEA